MSAQREHGSLAAVTNVFDSRRDPVKHKTKAAPPADPTSGSSGIDLVKAPIQQVLQTLQTSPTQGLSASEAQARLTKDGPNAVVTKHKSLFLVILGYFTGPIAYMIEAAAIVSAILGHWADFGIILALLLINAGLGFWQNRKAQNALKALQKGLAPTATVLRGGHWDTIPAANLVPGDIIRIRLGDIVPADIRIIGTGEVSIDQAALTGESMPVTKKAGLEAYSGSTVKEGEAAGVVIATGANTYLGRTTKLVAGAGAKSQAQKAMFDIGNFLIIIAVALAIIMVVVQVWRDVSAHDWKWDDALSILQFVLVLLVASIPVAMPAVFSVTMAIGALDLSKKKAIVSRLEAIEELAGVDILCSDKTGTLTTNSLAITKVIPVQETDQQNILLIASLASQKGDQDPIDDAVFHALADPHAAGSYKLVKFIPFDPVTKRSSADVIGPDGKPLIAVKGSVASILQMVNADEQLETQVSAIDKQLASEGNKSLGVAQSTDGGKTWTYLGVLALFDPPFPSSKETIQLVEAEGVHIKMVTGDDTDIAIETARQLGLGTNILSAPKIFPKGMNPNDVPDSIAEVISNADGFAQVFPEHKYAIVKVLQKQGHLVAMTGDGVNDAPALKQANCGIAVSDAVAAARSAAAVILTAPGLTVINTAIQEARRIFQRITSYTIYRVALTINIMFLVVLASIFLDFAPLTAIMIVVISLLDDVPIMTIAYDNTSIGKTPIRWNMKKIVLVSTFLGFFSLIQSFGMLIWAYYAATHNHMLGIDSTHIVTSIVFVQLVTGGHLLVLVARARTWFFLRPFPAWQLWVTLLAMATIGVLLAGFGWFIPKVPWPVIGIVLAYNLVWVFIMNLVKFGAEKLADHSTSTMKGHDHLWHVDLHKPSVDQHDLPKPASDSNASAQTTAPDPVASANTTASLGLGNAAGTPTPAAAPVGAAPAAAPPADASGTGSAPATGGTAPTS